jgi:alpha-L-fucosidase
MTLNDTWGYKKDDHNWKSPDDVIRKLADIAGKGGNFLLNVGPTAEGVIPAPSVRILQEVGRWLQVNGEAIYGTTFAPPDLAQPAWGRITRKRDRLYLIVWDWPQNGQPLALGLNPRRPYTARLLGSRRPVSVAPEAADRGVEVRLPAGPPPNPHAAVIVIENAV